MTNSFHILRRFKLKIQWWIVLTLTLIYSVYLIQNQTLKHYCWMKKGKKLHNDFKNHHICILLHETCVSPKVLSYFRLGICHLPKQNLTLKLYWLERENNTKLQKTERRCALISYNVRKMDNDRFWWMKVTEEIQTLFY